MSLVNRLSLHGTCLSFLLSLRIHSFNAIKEALISLASFTSTSVCFLLFLLLLAFESLPYSDPAKSAKTILQLFIDLDIWDSFTFNSFDKLVSLPISDSYVCRFCWVSLSIYLSSVQFGFGILLPSFCSSYWSLYAP